MDHIQGADGSILTVADLRKLVEQMRSAVPRCPGCGHSIHKAWTCGTVLNADGSVKSPRTCECNWTFELTPVGRA